MLVAGSLFLSYVFSYLFLWTVSPEVWAPATSVPGGTWPFASALLFVMAAASFVLAGRALPPPGARNLSAPILMMVGAVCLAGAIGTEIAGHWQAGLRPTGSSYGAIVYMSAGLTGQVAVAVLIMAAFAIARYFARMLDAERRGTYENTAIFLYYAVGQGLVGLLLVHGFPRLIGQP